MTSASTLERLRQKYQALYPDLDERGRRRWAAMEALALGRGGLSAVAQATGLARNTVAAGIRELSDPDAPPPDRVRRPGAGRKPCTQADPRLLPALAALVDPGTRGDPGSPLRWTCTSTRRLAAERTRQGHPVSDRTVARLLRGAGYSLQANRKAREGAAHPDRDAPFAFIDARVRSCRRRGQPAVSVDTKKKEPLGDFRNGGREWRPRGRPE